MTQKRGGGVRPRGPKTFFRLNSPMKSVSCSCMLKCKQLLSFLHLLAAMMVNTISEGLKAKEAYVFQHLSFMSSRNSCSVELSMEKSCMTSGPV